MPVIVAPTADAFVLLLLHTPPAMPSDNMIDDPAQTVDGPETVPAPADVPTRKTLVVVAVPQDDDTV